MALGFVLFFSVIWIEWYRTEKWKVALQGLVGRADLPVPLENFRRVKVNHESDGININSMN